MSSRGEKLNGQRRFKKMAQKTKAALEVFAEYGFHEATMEHILKGTGLSNGLVYHYFPSKEGKD